MWLLKKQKASNYPNNGGMMEDIVKGNIITISGIGSNKRGDMIIRKRQDNPSIPFWGVNARTKKRGIATKLYKFIAT